MKKKRAFLFILSFVIVSLLYRADFIVAMAAWQNTEGLPAAGEEPGSELGASRNPEEEAGNESAAGQPEEEPGSEPASGGNPEGEAGNEPAAGQPEEEPGSEPGASRNPEGEAGNEPAASHPEEEAGNEPAAGQPEEEPDSEPVTGGNPEGEAGNEPAAGQPEEEPGSEPASGEKPAEEAGNGPAAGSAMGLPESVVMSEPEESVSTGPAFIDWLESHKYTGGTVKLADHIVLDGDYSFYPGMPDMPEILVDTDRYTITVTGEIGLSGDHNLLFSGHPDGKSLFHVVEKGLLSMQGVAVESGHGAAWQEEGAGLVLSDCRISGSVHYADTPFVMYFRDDICAVVEKGQTINEALPARINCTVNYQGRLGNDEKVPVSWHLEGTEKQQEERRRFRVQGSFSGAASVEPASCTVVYNDYPLTFTDVKAEARGCLYTFHGGFTLPEGNLPFTVRAEYSFEGENWLLYEEQRISHAGSGFYIACKSEQSDGEYTGNIYIRLHWNDNGTGYFSNVLCYAADNLDAGEDIGGSRGGGTSITNPPDEPQEEPDGTSPEEENPTQGADRDSDPDKNDLENTDPDKNDPEKTTGAGRSESKAGTYADTTDDNAGQPLQAEPANSGAGRWSGAEVSETTKNRPAGMKAADTNAGQQPQAGAPETGEAAALYAQTEAGDAESVNHNGFAASEQGEAVDVFSPSGETGEGLAGIQGRTMRADNRRAGHMAAAAGLVLLAVIAGIAGFYAHTRYSRSGTNR